MNYEFDDVVTVRDIHGDDERCRVLWGTKSTTDANGSKVHIELRVRSLTKSHKKPFNVKVDKIIKHEPKRKVS